MSGKISIGDLFRNNQGSLVEVVYYENPKNIWVYFLDGSKYVMSVNYTQLVRGSFKNPFHPTVYNIGYIGFLYLKKKSIKNYRFVYLVWKSMLERCYSENYQVCDSPYIDCSVHPDWHNFSNFYIWYTNQENYGKGYHLDKDILFEGNKVYSKDTCCLLPQELNKIFTGAKLGKDKREVGVKKCKNGYISRLSINGDCRHLGVFSTVDEANEFYFLVKEVYVKKMAELWKSDLSDNVYQALMNWSFD